MSVSGPKAVRQFFCQPIAKADIGLAWALTDRFRPNCCHSGIRARCLKPDVGESMHIVELVWPPMWRRYTLMIGIGRLLHATLLIFGSMGVLLELTCWHVRSDHVVSYLLYWFGAAVLGRIVRAVLSRE